ncbi:MAG TPA: fumarylacetoacetate hydrolase family protein [Rhizomicrobium sp.]|nr:fumarylacetoacetate hydrolase family protein [Rhizomicrobium sp.]
MKLVTFAVDGSERVGAVVGDSVVDLSRGSFPQTMIGLIAGWSGVEADLRRFVANAKPDFALSQVRLRAPVPHPPKILAIGLNYADHIAETGREKPTQQVWFAKMSNAVNGPFDAIEKPKASDQVDYEAELVFIIGKKCRHVPKEKAHEVIFGYCAGNDVSVRDWQWATPQWIIGKSFDTHAPFGPWIVTADEIGDPHTLGIRCLVNGAVRQNSNTRELVFNVFDQVAHLSKAMTLEPGDAIFTGTPGGVGAAMKPPSFLKAGDTVRIEIDKIGALEARVSLEGDKL